VYQGRDYAIAGLLLEAVVLYALTETVGLPPIGWAAGLAQVVVTAVLFDRGLRRADDLRTRPADRVTLVRALLVGGITALVAMSFVRPIPVTALVVLAVPALLLDAVDGLVARRTDGGSPLGARFDMEVDAFLLCVLSIYDAPRFASWVLLIGAARYLMWGAAAAMPWLRRPVPPRFWRKVVAATQAVVLFIAATDLLPRPVIMLALAAALALLAESFGRDVWWLARQRQLLGQPTAALSLQTAA
jgi:phosphatidylglycerophosphate synthase